MADQEPGPGAAATAADRGWLRQAIELSRRCPPSPSAFCGRRGDRGRRRHGHGHRLLAGARPARPRGGGGAGQARPGDPRLAGATLYSSLEPCRFRASRPRPCAELIIAAGLRRVVIAWLEPPLFAQGGGAELLRSAGVTVVEVPELAAEARAVNAAVLGG